MDFVTFIRSLGLYFADSANAYLLLYAVVTCVLTQICKKLFVDKIKIEILNKFDIAAVIPYIFGVGCACIDVFWVKGVRTFNTEVILQLAVTCITVGAFATLLFKFCSSLSGQSLTSLMRDEVFRTMYNQLIYFGNARKQLLDKTVTLDEFVAQVKQLSQQAQDIFQSDADDAEKRERLKSLLQGNVDEQTLDKCIELLDESLQNSSAKK